MIRTGNSTLKLKVGVEGKFRPRTSHEALRSRKRILVLLFLLTLAIDGV